jgi:hypothetical protein
MFNIQKENSEVEHICMPETLGSIPQYQKKKKRKSINAMYYINSRRRGEPHEHSEEALEKI